MVGEPVGKLKEKFVTTDGSARAQERQRSAQVERSQQAPSLDFDRSGALGYHDQELVGAVLEEAAAGGVKTAALDELEQRFGWEGAAGRLQAVGPEGEAVAQGRWGQWLPPVDPTEPTDLPIGLSEASDVSPQSDSLEPVESPAELASEPAAVSPADRKD